MTGGRMSFNWIKTTMSAVVEARTLSRISSTSEKCEANGLSSWPTSVAIPKDLEMADMHND